MAGLPDYEVTRLKTSSRVRIGLSLAWKTSLAIRYEDLKVIDVSPIRSLFCNMNLDNNGTGGESTLVRRHPNNSEFLDLDAKFGKSFVLIISMMRIQHGLQQGNTIY